jgi:hypothetical protein
MVAIPESTTELITSSAKGIENIQHRKKKNILTLVIEFYTIVTMLSQVFDG